MNEFGLEKFSIYGLNGEYKVELEIIDNKKILVSENGSGKTTILGIFYSFFKKSNKISQYDFEYITLKIKNDNRNYIFYKGLLKVIFDTEFFQAVSLIDREDFDKLEEEVLKIKQKVKSSHDDYDYVDSLSLALCIYYFFDSDFNYKRMFFSKQHPELNDLFGRKSSHFLAQSFKLRLNKRFSYYRFEEVKIDFGNLYLDIHKIILNDNVENKQLSAILDYLKYLHSVIDSFNNREVLYLTTYRVIEKNINSFEPDNENELFFYDGVEGAKELFKDSPLIQFGMENVKKIWMDLSNKIRSSTTEEFLKLSGTLLKNVVENKKIEANDIQDLKDSRGSISKVLSRINQETFDEKDKKDLLLIIDNNDVNLNNKNVALFYILQNMVSIYENQKHIDQAINRYCNTINSFFENKKVIFNEITSEIYIEIIKNKRVIDIESLSSGEKQIISLFTKLYLTNIENDNLKYWIIYDEPEISLSIEWQESLLPQILKSERCEFLLSATHSPFIFKNELKKYTSDLALEISEI